MYVCKRTPLQPTVQDRSKVMSMNIGKGPSVKGRKSAGPSALACCKTMVRLSDRLAQCQLLAYLSLHTACFPVHLSWRGKALQSLID